MNETINNDVEIIDLRRIFILLYHAKWTIISICLFFVLIAFVYHHIEAPKYNSTFSVYYKRLTDNDNLDKEYWLKIMKSQGFIDKVILASHVNIGYNTFNITQKKGDDNMFNVSFTLADKNNIEPVAYGFVDALNSMEKENNIKRLSSFLKYLNEQLVENNKKLSVVNGLIGKSASVLDVGQVSDREQLKIIYNKYRQKLHDLEIELASVHSERLSIKKEFDYQQDTLFYETSFSEPLKVQLMNLKIDLAKAFTKYKKAHPIVLGIQDNINQVEIMLKKGAEQNIEIKNLSANPLKRDLYSSLTKTLIKEEALKTEIAATRKIVEGFGGQLDVNFDSENIFQLLQKREQYISTINLLNKRIIDTDNFLQSKTNNFLLVNVPDIPVNRSNKSIFFLIVIALFLGICIGVGYVVVLDFIDNRIRLVSDVESLAKIPILGVLDHRKNHNSLSKVCSLDINELNSLFYRELTQIRINVNQLIDEKKKVYSILSPSRREGKTYLSYLFAQELARSGCKVLLVDLDTYVPRLSKCTKIDDKTGLQDYLLDTSVRFDDCVNKTINENVDIIGCGRNEFGNQIFYDNVRFDQLLSEAAVCYDRIIIDTPGLLFFPEIVSFIKRVDYVLVVSRMHKTTRYKLRVLLKKINKFSVKNLGMIVTDKKQSPFSYENEYEYEYEYKK